MKVELKSKKTGRILLIGNIIKCDFKRIKLDSKNKYYNKKDVIVQYVIACIIIVFNVSILKSCKPLQSSNKTEMNNQIIDSKNDIIIQNIEEIELREN